MGQEDGTQEPAGKLHKWPFTMPLPCRNCNTEKELSAFIGTTTFAYDAIWENYISKGQDLVCTKCRQARGATNGTITIYCECCKTQKRRKEFEPEMAQRWENIQEDTYIVCKSCTRGGRQMGRKPTEKGVKYKCCGVGCSSETQQKEWIDNNFLEEHLTHAEENQRHAKCARCLVLEDNTISMKVKCNGCGVSKHLKEYSAIQCKEFLNGDRTFHKWQCYECWYPECSVPGCTERPLVAVAHNHVEADGSWYCHSHRYPPCSVCRMTPRPASAISGKIKFKAWICKTCNEPTNNGAMPGAPPAQPMSGADKEDGICMQSAGALQAQPSTIATDLTDVLRDDGRRNCELKPCTHCGKKCRADQLAAFPSGAFEDRGQVRCKICAFPTCKSCGHERQSNEGALTTREINSYRTSGNGNWYLSAP